MKNINRLILFCLFSSVSLLTNSRDLSFKVTVSSAKITEPIIMKVAVSGTKMVMEPQNMGTGGNMKILVDNTQNKQYMLMDMNGQKMAMAVDMSKYDKAVAATSEPKVTITKETRTISGYKCTRVITETEEQKADLWITPDVGMQYADFYKMLASSKGQNAMTRIPELKNVKGFPVEIVSTDKQKNETTTLKISDISKAKSDPKLFSMEGYQVMDAPGTTR